MITLCGIEGLKRVCEVLSRIMMLARHGLFVGNLLVTAQDGLLTVRPLQLSTSLNNNGYSTWVMFGVPGDVFQ